MKDIILADHFTSFLYFEDQTKSSGKYLLNHFQDCIEKVAIFSSSEKMNYWGVDVRGVRNFSYFWFALMYFHVKVFAIQSWNFVYTVFISSTFKIFLQIEQS